MGGGVHEKNNIEGEIAWKGGWELGHFTDLRGGA